MKFKLSNFLLTIIYLTLISVCIFKPISYSIAIETDVHPNLIKDGNVDESTIDIFNEQWNSLPDKTRNKIISKKWKIYITSYDIQEKYYDGPHKETIGGATFYQNKTIYINQMEDCQNRYVLFHELGHAIDYEMKQPSSSKIFKNIYNQEKTTIQDTFAVKDHHISSSNEYFASCIALYYKCPDILLQTAPKTYDYINNILTKF